MAGKWREDGADSSLHFPQPDACPGRDDRSCEDCVESTLDERMADFPIYDSAP